MKKLLFALCALVAWSASAVNPSFNSFDSRRFSTNNLSIGMTNLPKLDLMLDFGAVGDGVTDDTGAFMSASTNNNGRMVVVPSTANGYLVGNVILTNGSWFEGPAVIRMKTGISGAAFDGGHCTNIILKYLTILGTNSTAIPGVAGNRVGVRLNSVGISSLDHVNCFGFSDASFRIFAEIPIAQTMITNQVKINSCRARDSFYGWNTLSADVNNAAEYFILNDCSGINCGNGLYSQNGNMIVQGGEYNANTVGIAIVGGGNPAHGEVNNASINHNTTAIYCQGFNNSFLFQGNELLANTSINLSNCAGVVISGGTLSAQVNVWGNAAGAGMNWIKDVTYFTTKPKIVKISGGMVTDTGWVQGDATTYTTALFNNMPMPAARAWKTANYATNSVTTQFLDPDLQITGLSSNHTYIADLLISFDNAGTGGFSWTLNLTGFTAGDLSVLEFEHSSDGTTGNIPLRFHYASGGWNPASIVAAADQMNLAYTHTVVTATCIFKCTSDTDVKFYWAQFSSQAAATTVNKGSFLTVRQID